MQFGQRHDSGMCLLRQQHLVLGSEQPVDEGLEFLRPHSRQVAQGRPRGRYLETGQPEGVARTLVFRQAVPQAMDDDPNHFLDWLRTRSEYADLPAADRAEVAARWDLAALDAAVRASQRRRHLVTGALATGEAAPWDYQPPRDASREYIRNHMDLDDLEARARFPRVRAPAATPHQD